MKGVFKKILDFVSVAFVIAVTIGFIILVLSDPMHMKIFAFFCGIGFALWLMLYGSLTIAEWLDDKFPRYRR